MTHRRLLLFGIAIIIIGGGLFGFAPHAAALGCVSTGSGSWSVSGTWSCSRVPTTADSVTIFAGHNVTINTDTAAVTAVTINGTLTEDAGSHTLTVAGAWTNNGTFTKNNGTVKFTATATILGNTTFNNLEFGATTLLARIFTIGSASTATTLTVNGTLTISSSAPITLNTGNTNTSLSNINVTGNITVTNVSTTNNGACSAIITISGSDGSNQTLTGPGSINQGRLPKIVINKTNGGTFYLAGNISLANNFLYTAGTVDATTNNSTVYIGASLTTTSTGMQFNNLEVGAAALTLGSNLSVAGSLQTDTSSTLTMTTYNATVTGALVLVGGTISGVGGGIITAGSYDVRAGTISAILAGAGAVTKTASGTVTLSGANTYTSVTNINAGILSISKNSALGTTDSGTTVADGAQLVLNDASGMTLIAEPLTLNGTGISSGGALRSNSGYIPSWNGAITLGSDASIYSHSTFVVASGISGTHNLTLGADAGNLTASGGITITGNLTINNAGSGTITISTTAVNNTGTITNSGLGSGGGTISAIIGTNVTGVIQNSLTSTLSLSGNNTFTSGLTIKAGTVSGGTSVNAFGADATLGAGKGTITIGDSSGSANATLASTIGGTYGSPGTFANPITVAAGSSGNTLKISSGPYAAFSGLVTLNNNLTLYELGNTLFFTGGFAGTGNLTLNSPSGGIEIKTGSVNMTGTITNSVTGSGTVISAVIGPNVTGVIQNGSTSGSLTLSGVNTFTGGLTIKAGTVIGQTSNNALGADTSTITIGDSSGSADATLAVYGNRTFANPITVASGSGGTLSIKSITNSPILSGPIVLNNNLTINDADSITLNGNISGTGNITINGSGAKVTISGTSINNAGTITNAGTGSGSTGTTISGIIGTSVTGVIQNSTTMTLSLSGNNTFTSGLNILAGTVVGLGQTSVNALGASASLGAGRGTVTLGDGLADGVSATLAGDSATFANPIVLASNTSGTLTITNSLVTKTPIFSGGVTGNNNLVINAPSSNGSGVRFSTNDINNSGSITIIGSGSSSIVVISSVIGSNVTGVIENSATMTLTLGGDNSSVGSVTITAGTLTLSGSTNISVAGNWSNAGTFTSGSGTVTFNGSGNSTIVTGGTGTTQDFQNFTVAKTGSGVAQLSTNGLDVDGTLTITSGTLDLNGQDVTSVTAINNSGTLKFSGDQTLNSKTPTNNASSTVEYSAASGSHNIKNWTYKTLKINGSGGTFVAPATLNVAENWINSAGTFSHNNGTVNLTGTNQTISGDTTFYNLTKSVAAADTLTFAAGSTQTIAGTLTLNGALNQLLSLRSDSSPTQWNINPQGTRAITYVDVKDSHNTNATAIPTAGFFITDSGNNLGWTFAVFYPVTGTLISTVFDTGVLHPAYNSIVWQGLLNSGAVRFQLATADSSTPADWSFLGPSCGAGDWYSPLPGAVAKVSYACARGGRYFKYKVGLCSSANCSDAALTTPTISKVTINYSP